MANITMPVKAVLTEEEARRLTTNSAEIAAAICDECFALIPLWLMVSHHQKVHGALCSTRRK